MRNLLIYKFIVLSLFAILGLGQAQQTDSTLLAQDTLGILNPYGVLLKSTLVPGTGQISQERLWEAAILYGSAVNYYYKAFYNFSRYSKTGNPHNLYKARSDLSIALFVHLLNIVDAYDSAFNQKVKGWNGTLFSDKPVKSPWGASLRSAFFPGWGQWYNEQYIKAGLYLGLVSVVGYQLNWFAEKYRETGKAKYKDNRYRYGWYLGLAYLLMLTDAHVDAYMFHFDKAIKLTVEPGQSSNTLKFGLSYSF